jgi:hypothetical protein
MRGCFSRAYVLKQPLLSCYDAKKGQAAYIKIVSKQQSINLMMPITSGKAWAGGNTQYLDFGGTKTNYDITTINIARRVFKLLYLISY